jgi:hypothetical protein
MVGARLFPVSRLEAGAAMTLVFMTVIGLPVMGMGFISQLYPIPVFLCSILLNAAVALAAWRLRPFPAIPLAPVGRLSHLERIILILLGVCVIVPIALSLLTFIPSALTYPVGQIDVSYVYLPNVLNFIQRGTVWDFNAIFSYFPFGYELSLSWSMLFLRNFALLGVLQCIPYIGFVAFALLNLMLVLRDKGGKVRQFTLLVCLILLLNMYTTRALYLEIFKSDILGGLGFLGGIFYLLRFWSVPGAGQRRDERHLILVGLCGGLMLSAKLTNVYFLVVLAAAHVLMLLVGDRTTIPILLRRSLRHAVFAGIPFIVVAGPWLIRTLTRLDLYRSDSATVTANQTRLIDLFAKPAFVSAIPVWLPTGCVFVIGAALLAVATFAGTRSRGVIVAGWVGVGLLLFGYYKLYVTQGFFDYLSLQTGPFYVAVVTLIVLVITALVARRQADWVFIMLGLFGCAATVILAIAPYGAGVRPSEPPELAWRIRLQYRYSPALLPLLIIALCALGARLLPKRLSAPGGAYLENSRERGASARWLAVFGIVISAFLIGAQNPAPDRLPDFYENHTSLYTPPANLEATSFFSWINHNVQGEVIYALNIPPGTLYGAGLANRVLYTSSGYSGTDGQQRYRFDDLVPYIEQERIGYIAISFVWNDVIHGALGPTPQVKAELAKLRERYSPIYDDGQYVVLATPFARYVPVDQINYSFETLSASDLFTVGWLPPEDVSGHTVRWTSRTQALIVISVVPERTYQIQFRVVGWAEPGLQNTLRLSVNGKDIALTRSAGTESAESVLYSGIIPAYALSKDGTSLTTLVLSTDRVVATRLVNDIPDPRGIALDRLKIIPAP